jgi:hypothetical protein
MAADGRTRIPRAALPDNCTPARVRQAALLLLTQLPNPPHREFWRITGCVVGERQRRQAEQIRFDRGAYLWASTHYLRRQDFLTSALK